MRKNGACVHAVLFDLDDTLFDHEHCARSGLEAVYSAHACLRHTPFGDLEAAHARCLEELHAEVLGGRLGLDAARIERFRRLFRCAGVDADDELAGSAAAAYREHYVGARQAIRGAAELLRAVRARARIGIVSNNLLEEQRQKLQRCGLEGLVDALVVSEEVGVLKPDAAIFHAALERLDCGPEAAVMIGDSWPADVLGARAAGIRAIWFNRWRRAKPAPLSDVREIRALEPPTAVLAAIYETARSS